MADGAALTVNIDMARGSTGRPMSDADIEDKVRTLCAGGGSGIDPQPLIDAVWSIDESFDAGAVMEFAG